MDETVKVYLKELIDYRDIHSLLVNKDRDGGDCLHNFPMHYVNLSYLDSLTEYYRPAIVDFKADLGACRLKPGQYVRHPDSKKWYSQLRYTSRDQVKSALAGMLYFGLTDEAAQLWIELKGRGLLHWNTEESDPPYHKKIADPVSLAEMALFIRAVPGLKGLKWLLPILDLDYLYTSLWAYKKWDASCKQYIELLAIERSGQLNFVTKWAIKLFKRNEQVATLIEEAFTVHSLAMAPLGWLLRVGYLKWSKS